MIRNYSDASTYIPDHTLVYYCITFFYSCDGQGFVLHKSFRGVVSLSCKLNTLIDGRENICCIQQFLI